MNVESCDCRFFEGTFPEGSLENGFFSIADDESHLYIVIPGMNGNPSAVPISRDPEVANKNRRTWLLTGPKEKPTLHPSLHVVGTWHGWLREGRLVSC